MAAPLTVDELKSKVAVEYSLRQACDILGKDTEGIEKLAEAVVRAQNRSHATRVDRRFPNTNQANNCWTAFNEYQICVEKRGRDDGVCLQRGRDYAAVCPQKWIEDWKDQLSQGKQMFVGKAFAGESE